jgi:hypothetical protein
MGTLSEAIKLAWSELFAVTQVRQTFDQLRQIVEIALMNFGQRTPRHARSYDGLLGRGVLCLIVMDFGFREVAALPLKTPIY